MNKTILIVGTFDTKNDELRFIQDVIHDQGGHFDDGCKRSKGPQTAN